MLTLCTGKPGSGKTVYAVDILLKVANKEIAQFEHIENIYNNISGFDFDKFKEHEINFYKLDFKKLRTHIKLLHNLFEANEHRDNLDDILIQYCKEHKIFNTYFIIDECHNYFESQDRSLMWWLTYHRHLHHEILFLTQNKSLINSKYRNIPEDFIEAQPRTKAISKTQMRYFHYTDFAQTKKNHYNTTALVVQDKHFEVYTSGNTSKQKQVGKKYIFIFAFLFIFFIGISIFFYNFFFTGHSTADKEEVEKKELKTTEEINPNDEELHNTNEIIEDENQLSNLKYMRLKCNTKLKYCLYKNQKINLDFYLKMKDLENFEEISISPYIKGFVYLDVFVTDTFYSIYNKEENENNSTANSPNFSIIN